MLRALVAVGADRASNPRQHSPNASSAARLYLPAWTLRAQPSLCDDALSVHGFSHGLIGGCQRRVIRLKNPPNAATLVAYPPSIHSLTCRARRGQCEHGISPELIPPLLLRMRQAVVAGRQESHRTAACRPGNRASGELRRRSELRAMRLYLLDFSCGRAYTAL